MLEQPGQGDLVRCRAEARCDHPKVQRIANIDENLAAGTLTLPIDNVRVLDAIGSSPGPGLCATASGQ